MLNYTKTIALSLIAVACLLVATACSGTQQKTFVADLQEASTIAASLVPTLQATGLLSTKTGTEVDGAAAVLSTIATEAASGQTTTAQIVTDSNALSSAIQSLSPAIGVPPTVAAKISALNAALQVVYTELPKTQPTAASAHAFARAGAITAHAAAPKISLGFGPVDTLKLKRIAAQAQSVHAALTGTK